MGGRDKNEKQRGWYSDNKDRVNEIRKLKRAGEPYEHLLKNKALSDSLASVKTAGGTGHSNTRASAWRQANTHKSAIYQYNYRSTLSDERRTQNLEYFREYNKKRRAAHNPCHDTAMETIVEEYNEAHGFTSLPSSCNQQTPSQVLGSSLLHPFSEFL